MNQSFVNGLYWLVGFHTIYVKPFTRLPRFYRVLLDFLFLLFDVSFPLVYTYTHMETLLMIERFNFGVQQ